MIMQEVNQLSGVRERCMPGVGATPALQPAASALPRWSLPPPGTGTYQPWTELGTRFSPGQNRVGSSSGTSLDRSEYQNQPTSSTCK
jgi:hypothetical protein